MGYSWTSNWWPKFLAGFAQDGGRGFGVTSGPMPSPGRNTMVFFMENSGLLTNFSGTSRRATYQPSEFL